MFLFGCSASHNKKTDLANDQWINQENYSENNFSAIQCVNPDEFGGDITSQKTAAILEAKGQLIQQIKEKIIANISSVRRLTYNDDGVNRLSDFSSAIESTSSLLLSGVRVVRTGYQKYPKEGLVYCAEVEIKKETIEMATEQLLPVLTKMLSDDEKKLLKTRLTAENILKEARIQAEKFEREY